jgi:hypothetical protein
MVDLQPESREAAIAHQKCKASGRPRCALAAEEGTMTWQMCEGTSHLVELIKVMFRWQSKFDRIKVKHITKAMSCTSQVSEPQI